MPNPSGTKSIRPNKAIAIITQDDGIKMEVLSLYLQTRDLSAVPFHPPEPKIGLPLATGVIVHFDRMASFDIQLVKRIAKPAALGTDVEDWDTEVKITLLDGTIITDKLVPRLHLAMLKGGHALGSFEIAVGKIRHVDFLWAK